MFKNKLKFILKNNKGILPSLPYILVALIFIVIPSILIVIKSFSPTSSGSIIENFNFINEYVWMKILKSIYIAIVATIICVLLSYPFAHFLAFGIKSKVSKSLIILLITAPIWMSFLIKIVGLKTLFDCINGYQNSTFGDIFTILGLVYIYIPFMILPIYNVLEGMPRNILFASHDLGRGSFYTFFKIVIPYTKTALFSGITLVFLPSLTTVAVPQFLNTSSSGTMIGDIIMEEGILAQISDISLARASTLAFIISLIVFGCGTIYVVTKKIIKITKERNK